MANIKGSPSRHTIESLKDRLQKVVGNEYSIISTEYTSYKDKNFTFKHNTCGYIYNTSPCNFFNGSRCYKCKQSENAKNVLKLKKSKYDLNWAKELVLENGNKEYKLLSKEYINVHNYVDILHIPCNTIFSPTLNNFRQGTRCPKCTKLSRGERFTEDALNKLNLLFETQKSFPDLKYKRKLKFDFWIPKLNIAIEYDGDQHYRKDSTYYSEESILRDNLKDEYCKEKGYKLIRIPYHKRTLKSILSYIESYL